MIAQSRQNNIILTILNIVFFFLGISGALAFNQNIEPLSFNFHPALDLIVISVSFFALSMLFSGLLSPPIFLYYGFINSSHLYSNPVGLTLSVIPLLVASYAGSITGQYTAADQEEKENLFSFKKEILVIFFAGILLAIVVGFLFSYLAKFDQSALLPFLEKSW
ncbi:MAG: hypothetical protein HYW50_04495 [Candidatus Diapherotrites archaeon]|nr:hypothetical protein [Candidatus Diapherotrites archaeon]